MKMNKTALGILSAAHLVTDINQGALPALLPYFKDALNLSYTMSGTILLSANLTSSIIQPAFGHLSDRRPIGWFIPLAPFIACLGLSATGFISRYGERDSDRGAFLDHMFTKGSMQGNKLAFTTRSVHGVAFEFKGTVDRGEGKTPGAEAYHVIKGTLTQITEDKDHKTSAQQREVVFKSFPAEAIMPPHRKD